MQGSSAGATTTSDRPPPPIVHLHTVRAPLRSFVAGGGLVAIAMLAASFLTWALAMDSAPLPMGTNSGFVPASSALPTPTPGPQVLILVTPTPLVWPTATPTDTPVPVPTTDPIQPYDPAMATPGATYRWMPTLVPVVVTPTPLSVCGYTPLGLEDLCTAPGTTPTPTAVPTATVFGIDTEG